jgi:hypothetical protein
MEDCKSKNEDMVVKLYKVSRNVCTFINERKMEKCFKPSIVFSDDLSTMALFAQDRTPTGPLGAIEY